MPQKTNVLTSRIGTCLSGKVVAIPNDLDTDQVSKFVSDFTIDEQIDLFCMSEALCMHYQQRPGERINTAVQLIFEHFQKTEMPTDFEETIEKQGLVTSYHRLRRGRELCLYLK